MRKSRLEVKRRAWGCVLEVFSLRVWLTPPAPQQLCRPRWLRSEEAAAAHVDPDDVSLLVVSDSSTPAETLVPVAADPHIKVCGRRENVREAKDRIMSVLDTKVNNASVVVVGLYLCVFLSPFYSLSFLLSSTVKPDHNSTRALHPELACGCRVVLVFVAMATYG